MTDTKRTSTGYTPLDIEITKAEEVSCGALGFLTRIRHFCDEEETDGVISAPAMGSICVRYRVSRRQRESWLRELMDVRFVAQNDTSYVDLRFGQWCRSKAVRDQQREAWREQAKIRRKQPKGAEQDQPDQMSMPDTQPDTRQDSTSDSTRDSGADSPPESNGASQDLVAASAPASASASASASLPNKKRESLVLDFFLGLGMSKFRLAAKATAIRNIARCQLPDELLVRELKRRAATFPAGDPPRSPDLFWPDVQVAENDWLKQRRGNGSNGFTSLGAVLREREVDPDEQLQRDPDELSEVVR